MSVEGLNQLYCCIAQLYRVFYNILAVFADKMTKMTKNRLVWTRMTKNRLVWTIMTGIANQTLVVANIYLGINIEM